MKTAHRIAAENYAAQRGWSDDKDYTISYNDLGNDGVVINGSVEINQYRDSTFSLRVRNGEIYERKDNGKKGRVITTYDLQTGVVY